MIWLASALSLPNVQTLREVNPQTTAFMEDSQQPPVQRWVVLSDIAESLQRAVVAAEDARFYEHNGFDWRAFQHAMKQNWERGAFAFGGSTITQQLAKNLYLSPSKNPFRKAKELAIALRIEQVLPKARILELYLNVVEWAPGIYGAEAAAQHYFGRSARHLSRSQAAFLASILPNPRIYGAQGYRLTRRARQILRHM